MHVWLNTYFLPEHGLSLDASEIDGVKPGDHRFSEKLTVVLSYVRV